MSYCVDAQSLDKYRFRCFDNYNKTWSIISTAGLSPARLLLPDMSIGVGVSGLITVDAEYSSEDHAKAALQRYHDRLANCNNPEVIV